VLQQLVSFKEKDRCLKHLYFLCVLYFTIVDLYILYCREQELSNLIQQKKYLKAIGLAITLEQPHRLLNILKGMILSPKHNSFK